MIASDRRVGHLALGALLFATGAAAQNLLVNGDFNTLNDATGWAFVGEDFEVSGGDADACFDSYSGIGQSPLSGQNLLNVFQCVALPPAATGNLTGSFSYQTFDTGLEPPDFVAVGLLYYDATNCSGVPLGGDNSQGGPSVAWSRIEVSVAVPSTARSVVFGVIGSSDSPDTYFVAFDRAYLGFSPRVFADDYEPEQLCRWSSVSP